MLVAALNIISGLIMPAVQGAGHRCPAYDGRDLCRCHATPSYHRRDHWICRHGRWPRAWAPRRLQRRADPQGFEPGITVVNSFCCRVLLPVASRVEMTDVLSVVAWPDLSLAATIYPSWRAAKLDPARGASTAARRRADARRGRVRDGRGETKVEVLNGASLELSPGNSVALIAPSGAEVERLHSGGPVEVPDAGADRRRRRPRP